MLLEPRRLLVVHIFLLLTGLPTGIPIGQNTGEGYRRKRQPENIQDRVANENPNAGQKQRNDSVIEVRYRILYASYVWCILPMKPFFLLILTSSSCQGVPTNVQKYQPEKYTGKVYRRKCQPGQRNRSDTVQQRRGIIGSGEREVIFPWYNPNR